MAFVGARDYYGVGHLVTTTFVQKNGKSGKNSKFFSFGRITYLINTRLLTRGFYKKKFFEEVIILVPNEILGFI